MPSAHRRNDSSAELWWSRWTYERLDLRRLKRTYTEFSEASDGGTKGL